MPLAKRIIEPIFIGRTPLDRNVKNKLEGHVVNSLAGVISQLSSLSKHAESLFGELIDEATEISHRSANLNERVLFLNKKVLELDDAEVWNGKYTLSETVSAEY